MCPLDIDNDGWYKCLSHFGTEKYNKEGKHKVTATSTNYPSIHPLSSGYWGKYGRHAGVSALGNEREKPVSRDCETKLARNEHRTGIRKDKRVWGDFVLR